MRIPSNFRRLASADGRPSRPGEFEIIDVQFSNGVQLRTFKLLNHYCPYTVQYVAQLFAYLNHFVIVGQEQLIITQQCIEVQDRELSALESSCDLNAYSSWCWSVDWHGEP